MKCRSLLSISKLVTHAPSAPVTPCPSADPPPLFSAHLAEPSHLTSPVQFLKLHHKPEMCSPSSHPLISPFPFHQILTFHLLTNLPFVNEEYTAAYYLLSRHFSVSIELTGLLFLIVTKYSVIQQHSLGTSRRRGTVLARGLPNNVSTHP